MPTIESSIEAALFARAASLPAVLGIPSTAIAWPNVTMSPKPATYLRVTHVPNKNRRLLISSGGPHERKGILQIDVFTPLDLGASGATEISGKVATHFATDGCMVKSGIVVMVTEAASVGPSFAGDTHWQVPISILYRTFA